MSTKRGRCHLKGWPGERSMRAVIAEKQGDYLTVVDDAVKEITTTTTKVKRRWYQRKES